MASGLLLVDVQLLTAREVEQFFAVEDDIEWIETEYQLMVANLELVEAQDELSDTEMEFVRKTRAVMGKAEDGIQTYVKRAQMNALLPFKVVQWCIHLFNAFGLRMELRRIKGEITQVRQDWRSVDFASRLRSRQYHVASSSQSQNSALAELDSALSDLENKVTPSDDNKWVRDELASLHVFLQEIDQEQGVQVLGERQKVWIQELRDIFQFVHKSRDEGDDAGKVIRKIQLKILELYRRYYTYGFGEILVNNGCRSIFPRIKMAASVKRQMTLTPRGSIEMLTVDLDLMKALHEDARSMGDLDKRAEVWLSQVQKISVDLEDLVERASNVNQRVLGNIIGEREILTELLQIRYEIRDIAARKMTYGIDSSLGEDPYGNQYFKTSVNQLILKQVAPISEDRDILISLTDRRRCVESIKKELELMRALLQDVQGMKNLDERLKVWVHYVRNVVRGASSVVELDVESFWNRRNETAFRIGQVRREIFLMSKWKHVYDIPDVKSRRHVVIFSYNQEETGNAGSGSFGGERDLVGALLKDILRINEPEQIMTSGFSLQNLDSDIGGDGILKAWLEEMISVFQNFGHSYFPHDRVRDKIRQLYETRIAYGIELRQRLPPCIVDKIKEKLLTDHEHRFIVPIVGMRDAHKEALQDVINNDNAIRNHFHWPAWVKVPKEFTATSISEEIACQDVEQQNAKFVEEVKSMSVNKRCLIVLDEIQTSEVWQLLEPVFQQISSGSRIILISNKQTCSLLNSTFETIDVTPGSDASITENRNVPSYLRRCLYYFLLFPADFEVPARRLIVLWVAESLVHARKNEPDSVEHVANRYLKQLIKLGKVSVTKENPNGEVKACKLADGTRETLLEMAKKAGFFQDENAIISRLVDHHGVDHQGTHNSCFIHIPNSSASASNYQSVVSFLSFNTEEGSKPGEDIGDFLRKCISSGLFRGMRVLDLERVFRPKLPKALSKLIFLRYLGLRWTYLEHLPKYVSKFLNLHILDMKHTYISILPKTIWKMQYLRHLYLSETYRTRFPDRPSGVSLTALQTLWGAFIDEHTCVTEGLDTLQDIRKLGLSCRPSSSSGNSRMSEQLDAVDKWISKLKFLENLRLKSRDEHMEAAALHLTSLEENTKLSTVYLLGKLNPPVIHRFPKSLTDITLSGSELTVDPMEFLGSLPNLQILRLLAQSVVRSRIHCSRRCFPVLKVLYIWKLESLERWEADEGALPSLKELEIRSCKNLEKLPDQLQHVEDLQIILTSMPEEFVLKTEGKYAKVKRVSEDEL